MLSSENLPSSTAILTLPKPLSTMLDASSQSLCLLTLFLQPVLSNISFSIAGKNTKLHPGYQTICTASN